MNQTIIHAIRNKLVLELAYKGYSRIVEPHTYGLNKDGREVIRGYQLGDPGAPSEGALTWPLLALDETLSITTTGQAFASVRSGYISSDPAIYHIFAQL